MTLLFYIPAILAIVWEFCVASSPIRVTKFIKGIKGKKFDECTLSQKSLSILMLLYTLWVLTGIFSSQWVIFLIIIILGIIPKKYPLHRWVDSFISMSLLIFLLINKFHLHIDLWQFIKSYTN